MSVPMKGSAAIRALVRRLELTENRQRSTLEQTVLQLEAARWQLEQMVTQERQGELKLAKKA